MADFLENFKNTMENSLGISRSLAGTPQKRRDLKNTIIDRFQYASPDYDETRVQEEIDYPYSISSRNGFYYYPFTLSRKNGDGAESRMGLLAVDLDGNITGAEFSTGESYTSSGAQKMLERARNSGWVLDLAEQDSNSSSDKKSFMDPNEDTSFIYDSNPLNPNRLYPYQSNGTKPFYADRINKEAHKKAMAATKFINNWRGL